VGGTGPPSQTTERVAELVARENERLTRLLRNLYQEFRPGWGGHSQLYEQICRELAQYFRCDSCELYLVQQEYDPDKPRFDEKLVLTAAFGPWERALAPRFVRRIMQTRYPLDGDSHTARRFRAGRALVDVCRADYGQQEGIPRDAEWHLVWSRENLYNVSRNIISCPILRHRSRGKNDPYPIGLIKLENRRPFRARAFESDCDPSWELYLGSYFELCSVAPYIRDLENRLSKLGDAEPVDSFFAPLHDGDGWRQHYQTHPGCEIYYQTVRNWLDTLRKTHGRIQTRNDLEIQYKEATEQLAEIMDLVVEVEVLLQTLSASVDKLDQTRRPGNVVEQTGAAKAEEAPMPFLFNIHELTRQARQSEACIREIRQAICLAVDKVTHGGQTELSDAFQNLTSWIAGEANAGSEYVNEYGRAGTQEGGPTISAHRGIEAKPRNLWDALVQEFSKRNRNKVSGVLLKKRKREELARNMCELLQGVAAAIINSRSGGIASDLTPRYLASYHCARQVMTTIQLCDAPAQPIIGTARLGHVLAAACMYAHSFDPDVDEARLYSIQSHVSQIIDNHLMERARDFEISFDQLELLGLTESSVEELERLEKLLRDATECQVAALRNYLVGQGKGDVFTVEGHPSSISNILEEIAFPRGVPVTLLRVTLASPESQRIPLKKAAWPDIPPKRLPRYLDLVATGTGQVMRFMVKSEAGLGKELPDLDEGLHRPSPRWLFELNRDLERFCRITRSK